MKTILASALCGLLSASAAPPVYFASPLGGANDAGAVYQVSGRHRTVLYDFCRKDDCADGATPLANLLVMPDGSLIGATSAGGVSGYGPDVPPAGVLFRLRPMSDGSWAEEVLYDFCPYFADCAHFGVASGSLRLVNANLIEGVMQTSDGTRGVRWRFKLVSMTGGPCWTPLQSWTK